MTAANSPWWKSGWGALLFFCLVSAQAQDLQDVVNINFVADVRLFTIMAAMNAGGFDYETAPAMHPVRLQARERFKSLDPALLRRLRDFYVAHRAADSPQREVAGYTSLALLLSDPPRFEVTIPPGDVPAEARQVLGFEQILPYFYQQAGLEALWLEVRPQYLVEIDKYKPIVRQSAEQALRYLKTDPRVAMDRQIVFMPDLMSAHGLANSRIVNNLYYLIVGPADTPARNLHNVRHEYLHFLLDPLLEKNALAVVEQQSVRQIFGARPGLPGKFGGDLRLLHVESLIEAIELRIDRPQDAEKELDRRHLAGSVLVHHYYDQLKQFESGTVSFPEFLPGAIQAFNAAGEIEIWTRLVARDDENRRAREGEAERERRQAERIESLSRANSLLQERKYDEAETQLLALRQKNASDPPVLFGLGQIELQRKNAATAEAYFRQVIDGNMAPAWMAARSRIYLATVYLAEGRVAEARALLEQVSRADGDLNGAQQEAKKRLAELPGS